MQIESQSRDGQVYQIKIKHLPASAAASPLRAIARCSDVKMLKINSLSWGDIAAGATVLVLLSIARIAVILSCSGIALRVAQTARLDIAGIIRIRISKENSEYTSGSETDN